MAEVKKKIGKMPCPNDSCDEVVTVKETGNGALSCTCQECDFAPYARKHTKVYADWLKKITPTTPAAEEQPAAAEEEQPPAKTAKKAGLIL